MSVAGLKKQFYKASQVSQVTLKRWNFETFPSRAQSLELEYTGVKLTPYFLKHTLDPGFVLHDTGSIYK